jgi:hypothetical protein
MTRECLCKEVDNQIQTYELKIKWTFDGPDSIVLL